MGNLDYPRTTLFVMDKDAWIKSKAQTELLGYSSVSEYIFSLLKADLDREVSLQLLLLELEKYYELDFYTLELVAEKTALPLRIVIKLMNELNLPLPEEKTFANMQRIHEEITKNKLLPREIQSILNLKKEFEKKDDLLNNADMLIALFPNEEERTMEVLTKVRSILLEVLENTNLEKLCKRCEERRNCRFGDIRRAFLESTLKYDEEVLADDPVLKLLREHNAENLFGKFVMFSVVEIIKRELRRIDEFRLGQVIEIQIPELKKQEREIDKERKKLKVELKMYLKNIALANEIEKINNTLVEPA
jgi:hypothetical protein